MNLKKFALGLGVTIGGLALLYLASQLMQITPMDGQTLFFFSGIAYFVSAIVGCFATFIGIVIAIRSFLKQSSEE